MTSLESLVKTVREGDAEAYSTIVRRFQDMAVGYGYSILHDFQLAEDAAQEAFLEAYRNIDKLRVPAAFPGWFRRIVFKQCDRISRDRHFAVLPLPESEDRESVEPTQAKAVEEGEMKDKLLGAIDSLPDQQREVITLFYVGGHSQNEIAEFLSVPVTTIKKRLFSARARLRELLIDMAEDSLREQRPSRDDFFATRVIEVLKAARLGDVLKVKELLEQDPRLLAARDPLGNTALILAVNSGHSQVAELLLRSGVRPDLYESASIGRTDLVVEFLTKDPSLLNSHSAEGFSPLALAAHFGHIETVNYLISLGANLDIVSRHPMQVTPLHAALFGRKKEAAIILIGAGANVKPKRGGTGWPRAGWTALHYAAGFGFTEVAQALLDCGAEVDVCDEEGKNPIQIAIENGYREIAELLRSQL